MTDQKNSPQPLSPEEYAKKRAHQLATHRKSKNVVDRRVFKPGAELMDRLDRMWHAVKPAVRPKKDAMFKDSVEKATRDMENAAIDNEIAKHRRDTAFYYDKMGMNPWEGPVRRPKAMAKPKR